ncbi:MAG: trigger factor [Rhodobacterales bacterium]|nr:MAG: trigger factor [Rhodobacterales bacterium]
MDQKVDEKLEKARLNFQMKGFRKGRTPLTMMKKMFGDSTKNEIIQELIDTNIKKHLDEKSHKPASQPKIELKEGKLDKNSDLTFTFKYEILPDIPELNFDEIKLSEYKISVDNDAIQKALDELAKSACTFEPKKKNEKTKQGDQVIIDFKGTINKIEFNGGSANDYPLVLGSNSFIPGFEEQLINCKVNDDKNVKVNFPKNYNNKDLAGKEAIFNCKIKKINKPIPAKINDDLAVKFSAKNLDELKTNIKERLSNEYESFSKSLMKKELMDEIEKKVKFDLPQSLIDSELNQIIQQNTQNSVEIEKDKINDKKKPTKEEKNLANRRVALGLFFAEEGNRNKITVSEKEYQDAVYREAMNYPGKEQEFIKFLDKNPMAKEQISAPIFENKVFDHIVKLTKKSEKAISFEQFKKKFDTNML